MKLLVGWPWDSPFTFTGFTENVLNLQRPEGVEVKFERGKGWCSAKRHTDICEKALKWGADLVCIIGSDQTYPEDMLVRLVNRYKETGGAAIAALVPFRGYVGSQEMKPFQPLAWKLVSDGVRPFRGIDLDPDMMQQIDPADGDLQRVNIIGTGVLMFPTQSLSRIPRPWFYDQVDRTTLHLLADMDSKFVWRLQVQGGVTIWVDTTIKVKHLHIFPIDETYQDRFLDWKEQRVVNEICSQKPEAKAVK